MDRPKSTERDEDNHPMLNPARRRQMSLPSRFILLVAVVHVRLLSLLGGTLPSCRAHVIDENENTPILMRRSKVSHPSIGPLLGHYRNLQTPRECNSIITTSSRDDILSILYTLVDGLYSSGSIVNQLAKGVLAAGLKYPIQAWKVCASCEVIREQLFANASFVGNTEENGFDTYCGGDRYGQNATMSGLLLLPTEREGGEAVIGTLKGAIFAPSWSPEIPTELLPTNVTEILSFSEDVRALISYYYDVAGALAVASSGAVTLVPDGFGYGASEGEVAKSNFVKQSFQTSSIPLWLYTQHMLANSTESCTVLENTATLLGYSEGANFAVATSAALHELGVNIVQVMLGGGFYKLSSVQLLKIYEDATAGNIALRQQYYFALLGNAYSSTNPDVPNTNEGQNLLSDAYTDPSDETMNVLRWVADGLSMEEIGQRMPQNLRDLFNPSIMSLAQSAAENGVTDPCVTNATEGATDKFCEAMIDNDLNSILESVSYLVQFCHSPEDDVAPYGNLPLTENGDFDNTNLELFQGLQGQLIPAGSHDDASFTCLFASIVPFASQNSPSNAVAPSTNPECYPAPSSEPSAAPTVSPMPSEQATPSPSQAPTVSSMPTSSPSVDVGGQPSEPTTSSASKIVNILVQPFVLSFFSCVIWALGAV